MKIKTNIVATICLYCFFGVSSACFADIYDGLMWSFGAADGVENGAFDPAKFRNELKVSSASGAEILSYNGPEGVTPFFTNMTVFVGSQAAEFENEPCLYFPQPTNWVANAESGGLDIVASMHNATLPREMLAEGDCTLFMRLKWDGRAAPQVGEAYPNNYSVSLFSNGRDWTSSTGWELYLDAYGGMVGNAYLGVGVGQRVLSTTQASVNDGKISGNYCDIYATQGWADIAITLSSRPDEGENGRTYVSFYKCQQSARTIACGSGFLENAISLNQNAIGKLAGDFSKSVTNSLNVRNFRGAIKSIKMWNRVLSREEIRAVFAGMRQTWTIGAENGSADEFSDETAVASYNPRTERWYTFPKTLTAQKPSVSISLAVPAHRVSLPRVLRIKPLFAEGDDGTGKLLNVALNGTHIGTVGLKTYTGNVWFFIPEERFAECPSEDGNMTITLTRSGDMSGDVSFDCLELGGSFQLGVENNTHTEFDFVSGIRTIHASIEDETALSAQLYPNQSLSVHFPLSQAIADRYKFEFKARFFWANPTALPISCTLNGATCEPDSIGAPNYTYSYVFEPGELSTENAMKFSVGSRPDGGSTGWGVDYWQLKIIDTQYYGLTVIIR